jgi:hypothetical protein
MFEAKMIRTTTLLILLLSAWLFATTQNWQRAGVILVSPHGITGESPLSYSMQDAKRISQALQEVGEVDSTMLLIIEAKSPKQVLQEIEAFAISLSKTTHNQPQLLLQFYYSGHGSEQNFHIHNQRLAFADVKSTLSLAKAQATIYVLDVCYGASFFTAKGFKTAPPVRLSMQLQDWTKGEVIISSSARNEESFEVKSLEGSVFTTQWVMGLRGAADKNRDGKVSLFEAYNFAYEQTVTYTAEKLHATQHPGYSMELTGAQDVLLSRPVAASSGIIFDRCPPGVYQIFNHSRQVMVGEVRIPEGEAFSLALEAGNYEVRNRKQQQAAWVRVGQGLQTLRASHFKQTPEYVASYRKGSSFQSTEIFDPIKFFQPFRIRVGFSKYHSYESKLYHVFNNPTSVDRYYGISNQFEQIPYTSAVAPNFTIEYERKNKHRLLFGLMYRQYQIWQESEGSESTYGGSLRFPVYRESSRLIAFTGFSLGYALPVWQMAQWDWYLEGRFTGGTVKVEASTTQRHELWDYTTSGTHQYSGDFNSFELGTAIEAPPWKGEFLITRMGIHGALAWWQGSVFFNELTASPLKEWSGRIELYFRTGLHRSHYVQ